MKCNSFICIGSYINFRYIIIYCNFLNYNQLQQSINVQMSSSITIVWCSASRLRPTKLSLEDIIVLGVEQLLLTDGRRKRGPSDLESSQSSTLSVLWLRPLPPRLDSPAEVSFNSWSLSFSLSVILLCWACTSLAIEVASVNRLFNSSTLWNVSFKLR